MTQLFFIVAEIPAEIKEKINIIGKANKPAFKPDTINIKTSKINPKILTM